MLPPNPVWRAKNFHENGLAVSVSTIDTKPLPTRDSRTRAPAKADPMANPPADLLKTFEPSPGDPFDHRRLCHLLRRAALGVSAVRVKQFTGKTPGQIVEALTSYDPVDDSPYA